MADIDIQPAGDDSFSIGANSFTLPTKLTDGEYVMSMNTINRGGAIQTRPGSASLVFNNPPEVPESGDCAGWWNFEWGVDIPQGTNIQGITMFTPTEGVASLVFVIDGSVYYTTYPFNQYNKLCDLQFSPYSKYIAWATCIQSTDYTADGDLIILERPRSILIIQDGATRAAYWDGVTAAHINPTVSDSEFTTVDRDGTPVGLWMKWSNNRLWVSRDDVVFASDLGNPLKFTEAQFLNEGRAFPLSGPCTGMIETPDQKGLLVFTKDNAVLFQTSIQNRELWLSTPDFFKTVLPEIGCVSPRSLVHQHGMIWWMTPRGLINLDDAAKANVTSKLMVRDQAMAGSKHTMSHDVTMACGSCFENFLFHAVPVGHKINTRLHVMDQAPSEQETINVWPSYWEGWRPVEFARGVIGSEERVFCISRDTDDVIRIWELFLKDKTDNGVPITCYVQTRTHLFESREYKKFRYAELEAVELHGDISLMVAAAGIRGGYQRIGGKEIVATKGQVYYDTIYGPTVPFASTRPQTRMIKTGDGSEASDCNGECVESERNGLIDKGFSLLIVWQGVAGFAAYQIFVQAEPRALEGACEEDESGEINLLTPDGCGSHEDLSTEKSFETFTATEEITPSYGYYGYYGITQATATSIISQAAAANKAASIASWFAAVNAGQMVLNQSSAYEGIVPLVPRVVSIGNVIFT